MRSAEDATTSSSRRSTNGDKESSSQHGTTGSQSTAVPPMQNTAASILINCQGNVTQSNFTNSGGQSSATATLTKAAPKESPVVPHRPPQNSTSAQRKRSRLGDDSGTQTGNINMTRIHDHVETVNTLIDNLAKSGSKGNIGLVRMQLSESVRGILTETTSILARMVNMQADRLQMQMSERQAKDKLVKVQEEVSTLQQQIIELQAQVNTNESGRGDKNANMNFVQAAMRGVGRQVAQGKQLPVPQIAPSLKYAPSECIIILKGGERGEMLTKKEQEEFKAGLKESLGEEDMKNISAIRPTRQGGHTLIFYNEQSRDAAYGKLRSIEEDRDITQDKTGIIAPKKKLSRAVCKEVPNELSMEQIKADMYGRHNPIMQQVHCDQRTCKSYRTRLGVIFEFSTAEMCALQAQDWRIRCNQGQEIRLEEYISIQQCYACGKFGHNAHECLASEEVCRLCGKTGHSGKQCEDRENRDAWRCINCIRMNQMKNTHLDVRHAAAQLHKCPVAQQQKQARKIQLASAGVFTTPIVKNELMKMLNTTETSGARREDGGQEKQNRNMRSRSRVKRNQRGNRGEMRNDTPLKNFVQATQNENMERRREEHPCVQRPRKATREQSTDGWQTVGKSGTFRKSDDSERGREAATQPGVNSVENYNIEDDEEDTRMTPSRTCPPMYNG